jgi:uncharacterized membrane protein YeiH
MIQAGVSSANMLYAFDLVGVAVSAMSGALAAGRKQFDLLGALVIGMATAVGGGTLRDLLLGRTPVFWVKDPTYVWVILGAVAFTLVLTRYRRPPLDALLIADALGLALFTILGTRIAEKSGAPEVISVLMGTITGSAGGVLRDVLCNEAPLILQSGRLYATTAIAGSATYILMEKLALPSSLAAAVGAATVAGLRFAAIRFGLTLPIYRVADDPAG